MRDRPFLEAGETPRKYSEVRAERGEGAFNERILAEIAVLEAEAREAADPAERTRLQCEAEELRAGLYHQSKR